MMIWVEILMTALLVAGIILIFRIDRKAFRDFFYNVKTDTTTHIRERKRKKHISMKKQVDLLSGKNRSNFLARSFMEATSILKDAHQEHRIKGVYILSAICGLFGLVVSLIFGNIFLAPPLTIGAALIPVWLVKLNASQNMKQLNSVYERMVKAMTVNMYRSMMPGDAFSEDKKD